MNKVSGTIKSSKGFYIGDICYVLHDTVYYGFWGDQMDFQMGIHQVPGTPWSFAVGKTAYGDGSYEDNRGNTYPVDAGIIGLVPLELVGKDGLDSGTVIRTPGTAEFVAEDGKFYISLLDRSVIEIDTHEEYWGEEDDADD